jgi:hypothetical protein
LTAALGVGLLAAFLLPGCGDDLKPQTGSETHFLTACSDDSCGAGVECVCGVCTKPCAADTECGGLGAKAACVSLAPRVAEGRCAENEAPAMCDIGCLQTSDCRKLGQGFVCDAGYCRQPGGTPEIDAGVCKSAPLAVSDLVVIGDANITLSTFVADLQSSATAAGLLAPGGTLRSYASPYYSILAGGDFGISHQYDMAQSDGPMRVVAMNGGETDVLNVPCGSAPTPTCPPIQAAAAGAESLFAAMAADGVEHVIYFYYGDFVGNADVKAGIDVLRPFIMNACGRAPLPCHFVDLRPIFADHPEYAAANPLIFSSYGAKAAADAVTRVMQDRCVAAAE